MENNTQMYSTERFSKNLQILLDNSGYTIYELEKELKYKFGKGISYKQLNKYLNGTAIPKADNLYILANFFSVAIDGLIGRCELDDFYYVKDDPNINKFHLNIDSRHKLTNMKNESEINILNKIIYSNIIQTFAIQLESAVAQIKTATDNKTKDDVTFFASCMVQMEINKLFKKCLNEYMKK